MKILKIFGVSIAGTFCVLFAYVGIFGDKANEQWDRHSAEQQIDQEKHEQKKLIKEVERSFNVLDGSHTQLKRYAKERMHDPKSFKGDSSDYVLKEDGTVVVTMHYSGTNAFGARVQDSITALCKPSGEIIQVY